MSAGSEKTRRRLIRVRHAQKTHTNLVHLFFQRAQLQLACAQLLSKPAGSCHRSLLCRVQGGDLESLSFKSNLLPTVKNGRYVVERHSVREGQGVVRVSLFVGRILNGKMLLQKNAVAPDLFNGIGVQTLAVSVKFSPQRLGKFSNGVRYSEA